MNKISILLADDDRLILATLSKGLRDASYLVTEATNGLEAVQLGCEIKPDLAVLDIRMPGLSGIDVARQLREKVDVYSLCLTAYDDEELVEQAIGEGALGYLVKPVELRQVIPAIETAQERAIELRQLTKTKEALSQSLEKNQSINTAIGIYMERYLVSELNAFETLRAFARSERRKLLDVAEELVRTTGRRNEVAERIHQVGSLKAHKVRTVIGKRSP